MATWQPPVCFAVEAFLPPPAKMLANFPVHPFPFNLSRLPFPFSLSRSSFPVQPFLFNLPVQPFLSNSPQRCICPALRPPVPAEPVRRLQGPHCDGCVVHHQLPRARDQGHAGEAGHRARLHHYHSQPHQHTGEERGPQSLRASDPQSLRAAEPRGCDTGTCCRLPALRI
eukprot:355399-Chlamydomonas_euryale.AAC.3